MTSIGGCSFATCPALEDVNYTGTEEAWNAIALGEFNTSLTGANIHCGA